MKTMLLAAALGIAAPVYAAPPTHIESAALVAAETSLIIDAIQTFDIKNHESFVESNPILGSAPSDPAIVGYFAGTMALTAAAWYLLPSKWRLLVPAVVLGFEVPQVAGNSARIARDALYCAKCDPRNGRQAHTRGVLLKVRF